MAVRPTSCPGRGQPDWMLATGGWSIVGLARLARRLPTIGLPLTPDDHRPKRFFAAPRVNRWEFAQARRDVFAVGSELTLFTAGIVSGRNIVARMRTHRSARRTERWFATSAPHASSFSLIRGRSSRTSITAT
jgi:hypothetical protein